MEEPEIEREKCADRGDEPDPPVPLDHAKTPSLVGPEVSSPFEHGGFTGPTSADRADGESACGLLPSNPKGSRAWDLLGAWSRLTIRGPPVCHGRPHGSIAPSSDTPGSVCRSPGPGGGGLRGSELRPRSRPGQPFRTAGPRSVPLR